MLGRMSTQADTRQRIMQAAGELIAARSYADVGVAEICTAAAVKKGSFYHFFPSKRELSVAVLDATFVDFKLRLLDEAFSRKLAPFERFRAFSRMIYLFQAESARELGFVPGCPFGNMAAEQATQDDVLRLKVQQLFDSLIGEFRLALAEAVQAGEIEPLDIEATASAMLAYVEGVLLLAKTRNDVELIAQLMPGMLQVRIEPGSS